MAVLVVRQTHLAVSVGGLGFPGRTGILASPKISAERKYPPRENIRAEKISVWREYLFGENQNVVGSYCPDRN